MNNLFTKNALKPMRWLMVLVVMVTATIGNVWAQQTFTDGGNTYTVSTGGSGNYTACTNTGGVTCNAGVYQSGLVRFRVNSITNSNITFEISGCVTNPYSASTCYNVSVRSSICSVTLPSNILTSNTNSVNIATGNNRFFEANTSSLSNGTNTLYMMVEQLNPNTCGGVTPNRLLYYSQPMTITKTGGNEPSAPTLYASPNGTNGISLSWTNTGTSYDVYYNGNWFNNTSNTTMGVAGLSAGTQYCYTVRACNNFGCSGSSNQACATTATPSPYLSVSPTSATIGSSAGSGSSSSVSSNISWNASSSASWLSISSPSGSNNGTLSFSANSANTSTSSRTGTITVSANGVSTQYITVTQQGASSSLSVSPTSATIGSSAGSGSSSSVSSNISWNASSNAGWLSVAPSSGSNNGTLSFSANSANTSTSSRTGTITVSGNGASAQITVTQQGVASTSVIALSIASGTNFGAVSIGQTVQRSLRIANTGNSTLTVNSINYPSGFSGSWAGTVAPSNYYDVPVTFAPTSATMSYGGNITVNSSATSGSNSIAVQGSGVALPSISIDNAGSVIPPYQRQGDSFSGSIKATIISGGGTWQLQVLKGSTTIWTSVSASSGQSIPFSSANLTITSGDEISYKAVLVGGSSSSVATQKTKINAPKLNKETFVIVKGNTTDRIRIPFKYSTNLSEKPAKVKIKNLYDGSKPIKYNGNSEEFPLNSSTIESEGIFYISNANANIVATGASVFEYSLLNSTNVVVDTGRFETVLLGRTHTNNTSSSKVLIAIGGRKNELNTDVANMQNSLQNTGSDKDFSIINYDKFSNTGNFDCWFIHAANVSYTQRNAHAIGIAMQRLLQEKNNNVTEINLITHSKGGLDTKALLADKACSYKNHSNTDWPPTTTDVSKAGNIKYDATSPLYGKIKRVLFLGTPHYGGLKDILKYTASTYDNSPATKELTFVIGYGITIKELDNINYSNLGIKFANLTGYGGNGAGDGDGVVPASSSKSFTDRNPSVTTQLYSIANGEPFYHTSLHKNKILSTDENPCSNASNNLSEIYNFFTSNNAVNCIYIRKNTLSFIGSKVTNAKVSLKKGTPAYNLIGYSGINGSSSLITGAADVYDSVKIEANGYETVRIGLNSLVGGTKATSIPMLPAILSTNKIVRPDLTVNDNKLVVSTPSATIRVSGTNVLSYQIFQNGAYINLIANNGYATIPLVDTGYNEIKIRFLGNSDTTVLVRPIFYYPSSLLASNTFTASIGIPAYFKGCDVFSNGTFLGKASVSPFNVVLPHNLHEIKLKKYGYKDTVVFMSSQTPTLTLTSVPTLTLASATAVQTVNFAEQRVAYWKGMTIRNTGTSSRSVELKRQSKTYAAQNVTALSETFQVKQLTGVSANTINVATVLEQANAPSPKNVYVLNIRNSTNFVKIPSTQYAANGVVYDSTFQKFSFNVNNASATNEYVLAQRKAPLAVSAAATSICDSVALPFSTFFTDPDNIPNDLTIALGSYNTAQWSVSVVGSTLKIKRLVGNGSLTLALTATHDGLTATNNLQVNALHQANAVQTGGNLSVNTTTGASYQWLLDGQPITGATQANYTPAVSGTYAVRVTLNGCATTSNTINVQVTSIADKIATAVSVYPNPSSGQITLTLDNLHNVNVRISDAVGKQILEQKVTGNTAQFNLPKGVYFLRVSSKEGTTVKQVVVQ